MITINQISDQFNRIATAHKDINSYNFGDMWEISVSGDVKYPQLYVVPQPITFNERQVDFVFNVIVMDRVNKGEVGEIDALSDTNQILGDVLSLLDHPDYEWVLNKNSTATPFTESFDDELTGWNCSVTLSVPFSYNRCAVPAGTIDIDFDYTLESGGGSQSSGTGANPLNHNGLSGLQGGTTDQYYHLTLAQYNALGQGGGSGITSINGLTGLTQTFNVGDSGVDFNIQSSGTTHWWNLPTASSSKRGLLSSSDWSTFNDKQAALGYTAENSANKDTDSTFAANSATRYPSQSAVKTAFDLKANLASPTFTGIPAAPTAAANNNSTQIATTAYVDSAIIPAWTDYSATSTVIGWVSFTVKVIKYIVQGKRTTIFFDLEGTSNSATSSFTLPNTIANNGAATVGVIYVQNNGTVQAAGGRSIAQANTSLVTLSRDFTGLAWTSSGSKACVGFLIYENA